MLISTLITLEKNLLLARNQLGQAIHDYKDCCLTSKIIFIAFP
jgi:hypothetical protein